MMAVVQVGEYGRAARIGDAPIPRSFPGCGDRDGRARSQRPRHGLHFTLVAMARLFASRYERQFSARAGKAGQPPPRANSVLLLVTR